MGYSTDFFGEFGFHRKPSQAVLQQIRDISGVDTRDLEDGDEQNYPSCYCQWELTDDDKGLRWDGNEKFDAYVEWLEWIIDKILKPGGIKLAGTVSYQGDDSKDRGVLTIDKDQNVVQTPATEVGDTLDELREFRDFVLESSFADEILDEWRDR